MSPSLDESESLLVDGPALSGRRRVFHRTLHRSSGTVVIISTRQPADGARNTHRRLTDSSGRNRSTSEVTDPLVIDCVTNAVEKSPVDDDKTRHAQHPSNLTSIGTKFTELVEDREDESLVIGIDTVSTLLQYADSDEMFRFLNVIVQQATGVGCSVTIGIDGCAHEEQTLLQLAHIFDRVIKINQNGDGSGFGIRNYDPYS